MKTSDRFSVRQFAQHWCHKKLTKVPSPIVTIPNQPARPRAAAGFFISTPNHTPPLMIPHLHRHIPHPCRALRRTRRRLAIRPNRKWFPISLALAGLALALACTSCTEPPAPEPPPVPVTDTKPVGEGLKVIGYAMLGAAVVVVLGRMIR